MQVEVADVSSIDIQLEDDNGAPTMLVVTYESSERICDVIARLDREHELDRGAALEAAIATIPVRDYNHLLREVAWPGQPIILRRVCLELHFESDSKRAWFPTRAKWSLRRSAKSARLCSAEVVRTGYRVARKTSVHSDRAALASI